MHSLYSLLKPVLVKQLNALDGVLSKAEAYAKEKNIAEADLLQERLASDMFPLVKQVQVACDNAKGAMARLSGSEAPKHEDTEQSFAELRARIAKTVEFVNSVSEESFVGAEERQITLPYFPGLYMTGLDYAREYVLPNFFFHVTTAYAILRKHGAAIGKADYMGGLPLKNLA